MFKRGPLLIFALLAAIFGPMMLTSSDGILQSAASALKSFTGRDAAQPPLNLSPPPKMPSGNPTVTEIVGNSISQPIGGAPQFPVSLPEALRFDIAPAWIISRWPHVLTMADAGPFQGYRVPLVTGTAEHDIAGTLTYYFSPKPELKRIKLTGVTGDPAAVVSLVTSRFGFTKQPSPIPGTHLYQIVYGKRPNSQLLIRMHETIRNDRPLRRFDVDLEVNLPEVPPSGLLVGQTPPPPPAPPSVPKPKP
jgi:hypothetical protein